MRSCKSHRKKPLKKIRKTFYLNTFTYFYIFLYNAGWYCLKCSRKLGHSRATWLSLSTTLCYHEALYAPLIVIILVMHCVFTNLHILDPPHSCWLSIVVFFRCWILLLHGFNLILTVFFFRLDLILSSWGQPTFSKRSIQNGFVLHHFVYYHLSGLFQPLRRLFRLLIILGYLRLWLTNTRLHHGLPNLSSFV